MSDTDTILAKEIRANLESHGGSKAIAMVLRDVIDELTDALRAANDDRLMAWDISRLAVVESVMGRLIKKMTGEALE